MEASYDSDIISGYILDRDPFDKIEECDYPDGPDENLSGIKYPDYDFSDFNYYEPDIDRYEQEIDDEYDEYIIESSEEYFEELHMKKLIKEHLSEEKAFLDSLIEPVFNEEYATMSYVEEIIFVD